MPRLQVFRFMLAALAAWLLTQPISLQTARGDLETDTTITAAVATATDAAGDTEAGGKDEKQEKKSDEKSDEKGDGAEEKEAGDEAGKEEENDEEESEEEESEEEESEEEDEEEDEVELTGRFVAVEAAEISIRPEEWSQLQVEMAVAHGAKIRKGDVLLKLKTDKLDLALEGLQQDVELGRIGVEQAEESLSLLRKSTALSIATAEVKEQRASEDLKRFLTTDKEASKKSADFSLKSSKNYVAYQEEELKQLEQMYKEDDLTEETEEIILKRTRDQVDSARFSLERSKLNHERSLEVELPRQQEDLEQAVQQAAIELQRVTDTLPSKILQEELGLKKLLLKQKELEAKLKRMESDREMLTLKAPMSGIVYHGECKQGKWSDVATLAAMLRPGGQVKSDQTIMTVVAMRPLQVRFEITEKVLRHAKVGAEVEIEPTALPEAEFAGKIESISAVPIGDGRFEAMASVDLTSPADSIVPGMSCTVEWDIQGDEEDEGEDEEDEGEDD